MTINTNMTNICQRCDVRFDDIDAHNVVCLPDDSEQYVVTE